MCLFDGAWGLNTLTSMKVFSKVPSHNTFAAMSSRAPFWWLTEAPIRASFVTSCNPGSIHTSWYTSVSRVAVRLRISMCLIDGNPPLAHDKACSTGNLLPQVHIDGISDGVQPYLRAKASWKAPL